MKYRKGFTIVELLIVIVVIGILAALVTVTYSGIQQRTQATALYDAIQKYKRSFKAYAVSAGYDSWPRETHFLSGENPNPSINYIAGESQYRDFIRPVTNSFGVTSSLWWFYDNDGDTAHGDPDCNTLHVGGGVTIIVPGVAQEKAQYIDDLKDDGNLNCGKIRFQAGGNTVFVLATHESEF